MKFNAEPEMALEPGASYRAEVLTSKGRMIITLHPEMAPRAVNSFVFLARQGYFDGVSFHRIIPGFVVQGGDPTGTGAGGPGYRFPDELPPPGAYEIGSVAMANAGPDTNGSQFFIVSGDHGTQLPPQYTLFGTVKEGLDTVQALDAVGTRSGKPTEQVTIESITILEAQG
jgi:peptidylprolyl isomerase